MSQDTMTTRCLCGLRVSHHFNSRNQKLSCTEARHLHPRALRQRRLLCTLLRESLKVAVVGAMATALLLLLAWPAPAQSLKLPTATFAAAAAADWISTARLRSPIPFYDAQITEKNPLINHLGPRGMIVAGAAIDAAGLLVWNRLVGPRHPRLAAAGLYAATALRLYFAFDNSQQLARVRRWPALPEVGR